MGLFDLVKKKHNYALLFYFFAQSKAIASHIYKTH